MTALPLVADRHVETALAQIDEAIAGLRKLAELVTDRPEIAESVSSGLDRERSPRILLYVNDRRANGASIPEYIAGMGAAASDHGAEVSGCHDDTWGGINAQFGFVTLHVYAHLDEVGSVATHTRSVQVTEWQPDPALAALAAGR
jgi:hypothetical protein